MTSPTPWAATARSCANIAFIKYWGRRDHALRLPLNGSISMNLDGATTTTTVIFDPALDADQVTILDVETTEKAARRVSEHLDRVRARAGIDIRARVVSRNSFPMGTGIASSASAFAALTAAACAAAGLDLSDRELSILARLGSGSACRSIPAGFVEWHAGESSETSYAEMIAPPEHWDLRDLIAIVETAHKEVGSSKGQELVDASPFGAARLAAAERGLPVVRRAILERDFETFGEETEQEAIRMHAVALTSRPSVLYWSPATVRIMHAVRAWRAEGLPAYFTIDAGANVHVLCQGADAGALAEQLRALEGVHSVLSNRPGPATRLIDTHLLSD
ncbi:MAG TPA: diphosphomevalonate decarboxylase [Aggregatilineaceae bacterium]|nr:diphosphomevalonate decarboxylase [Aggregatilineaceae bacterium]